MIRIALGLTLGVSAFGTTLAGAPPQGPSLSDLLGGAAAYVTKYEAGVSAIGLEEHYVQTVNRTQHPRGLSRRELRSELLLINAGPSGWTAFRDVVNVDGTPVRDREDRLQTLLLESTPDALDRARTIAAESARFNIGSVQRTLNYPTMALTFLRTPLQHRSQFSRRGSDRVGDVSTWVLEFREKARPSLIESRTPESTVSGRFWIEPSSGRVWRSQVTIEEERSTGNFDVRYGAWPGLDVLVPITMDESIAVRDGQNRPFYTVEVMTGQARYTNPTRFTVTIDASFK